CLVLLLVAALPLGCTHIIPQTTPYYKNGPDQPESPQGDVPAGAKAWVLWRKNSYAHVWTDGGIDAWVWDRAVVSIWEHESELRKEKKQAEEREKVLKAQQQQAARQRMVQPESQPSAPTK